MHFEIVDTEDNLITTLDLESNPFKVGEILHLDVKNHDPSFWKQKEMRKDFVIQNIQHFAKHKFLPNHHHDLTFTVSVTVKEVEE